jgi:ATP-dependent exoDNAse (exonuclease V) alpha subunit
MRGQVVGVDRATGALTLDVDDGTRVEISMAYQHADGVEHGWAITGHCAQGITVDRAFVVAPGDGAHAEWSYVALSRAREAVHLFVATTPETDVLDAVAHALRTPAARPLALTELGASPEQIPQLENVHADPRQIVGHGPHLTPDHKATLTQEAEIDR